MTYIGLGCLCFLFFILYDLNQIHKNHRGIRPLFAVGCITLCVLTITMSVTEFESDYQVTFPAVAVFFLLAGIQLMLLVYTLFFAVPFQEASRRQSRISGEPFPLPLMGIMRISCWQRRRTCCPGNRLSGFRLHGRAANIRSK